MLQIKLIALGVCYGTYINKHPFFTNCELFIPYTYCMHQVVGDVDT